MTDQTAILQKLGDGEARSLDDICGLLQPGKPCAYGTAIRQQVLLGLGHLLQRGLVERLKAPRKTFGGPVVMTFHATKAGREAAASGTVIKSGPRGKHSGVRKAEKTPTMRQRAWEALQQARRIGKKTTLVELADLIRRKEDGPGGNLTDNLGKYLLRLKRAGIVVAMGQRQVGHGPNSRGSIRYALLLDLGPIAPSTGEHFVADHNARTATPPREARIPYKETT